MSLMHLLRKAYYRTVIRNVPKKKREREELAAAGFASQYGQDQFVVERLGGMRGGVFIDIGAYDGVKLSNTYYLETQLGWNGIAVEPSRVAFERLVKSRKCIAVNGCVAPTPGEVQFLEIEGHGSMLSGIVREYHPRHITRIDRVLTEGVGQRVERKVPCYTIAQLVAEHRLGPIDYLSIDTEGGELAILQSIDFGAIDINLITVENNYADTSTRNFMQGAGFAMVARIACDEVYQNKKYL